MTREPREPDLDKVRFFVDEDLAGLGLGLMRLRKDVVTGSHKPVAGLIPPRDEDWIRAVADRGWVAITNDRHIRTRHYEAKAALESELRCVCLRPSVRNATVWDFARVLIAHWEAVEQLCASTGPGWLEVRTPRAWRMDYQPGKPPRLPPNSLS